MTNRSAKGGTRSSPHYGGEGALIHPPHQGVCGRHGTEDQGVTPGGLGEFPIGIGRSGPISASEAGSGARRVVGRPSSTLRTVKVVRPRKGAAGAGWGRRSAKKVGKRTRNQMSKGEEEEQFHE